MSSKAKPVRSSSKGSSRGRASSTTPITPRSRIDVPAAIRGGSAGFSILLIGGLLSPLVALAVPRLGGVWLTMIAIVSFAIAARRIGNASVPQLHGAVAAVFAYVLVLPLLLPFEGGRNLPQILLTLATAISVGASTGWIQSKRANPSTT